MKFLVDVCAGKRLAQWLKAQGHDVQEVRERSASMEDEEILAWAFTEGRIIVAEVILRHEEALKKGAIITVSRTRIRVRRNTISKNCHHVGHGLCPVPTCKAQALSYPTKFVGGAWKPRPTPLYENFLKRYE